MAEQTGVNKISSIRKTYIAYQLIADVLFAGAVTVIIVAILNYVLHASIFWALPLFIASFLVLLFVHKTWAISNVSIANFLNQQYPQLEESSGLILKSTTELNLLEKFQLQKAEAQLQEIPLSHKFFFKRPKLALVLFILALGLSWLSGKTLRQPLRGVDGDKSSTEKAALPEKTLPQISAVAIRVIPPSYTGKSERQQDKFTLNVEDGATVHWNISTNIAVKQVALLFNDKEIIKLKSTDGNTQWQVGKLISKPGFYQVYVDGKLSDLYQVQVITDQPPVIRIKTPKQYTYIDAGEAQKVNINTVVNDDYGVSNATIFATVAKGSGEAVKFKEYKLDFSASFATHQPQYNLQKLINLPDLKMEPGDELYFYVQATDTHQQQTRTDVYTVTIQDTAQLLSMDGMLNGVNQKPEFFRSERQIILDTEHLLKDKDSISVAKFNDQSNDLGVDQKLLRLRYGKFLGEESESDINPADDKNDPVGDIKNYGNAAVVLDKYTDKHDNAEDAQFFDPELKKQLKATLTEMWKAELQLRLYKPQDALPFEYKALRLLKDLQQKSRMYVAKTAYNPPALKMEKRLSGDLSKIDQPLYKQDIKSGTDQFENLKKAVTVLAQLKINLKINDADKHILALANQQLSFKASAQPGAYLSALSAMRRILSGDEHINTTDVALVEKAIQKTLANAVKSPTANAGAIDLGLSRDYYKTLKTVN